MAARSSFAGPPLSRSSCSLVRRRSPRSKIRSVARWLALIAITQQISCSGGAGNSVTANVDPMLSVTLSLSPSSAQVSAGGSVQFAVTVQNASNPAVNWQVNGIPGGNSAVGTIASAGPVVASYSAPASVLNPLTVTVTAVLQADPTKSTSATVTVNPLPGPQITISPANATVVQGMSLQFSATVQNGPQAVIWEVNNIPGGSVKFGTISSSGFYAAPTQIPNPPVVTITALLFSDSSISGSTSLTIVPPIPTVSISPNTANVIEGQSLQFSATVQNSTASVTWEVNNIAGGNSTVGTISTSGTYSAPIPPNPQSLPLAVTVSAVLETNPPISASAGVTVISGNTLAGIYSWKNNNSLTGQNGQETILNPSSLSGGTGHTFGKLFGCQVDGAIFAQPLYVANVTIPNLGTHNVVYVATENDSVYAFDADSSSCQILWQLSFTNQALAITAVPAADIQGQTDIMPVIGITGSPVIDPKTATLYVVSKTKTNQGATPSYNQQLHALDLSTGWVGGVAGSEKFGGPVEIQAIVNGTGAGSNSSSISFDSLTLMENQRTALLLANGNIYVAFDSYSDSDPFHGWVFSYSAANLQSAPAVFITTPNGSRGGIGESGAAPSADSNGDIFVTTSDGTPLDPSTESDYPQTLLKLQANTGNAFTIADSFTPSNEPTLEAQLRSFGSTGVLLLPNSDANTAPPAIAGSEAAGGVASSPDLYLLNSANLGNAQTLCLTANGAPASVFGTPGYWTASNGVYVVAANDSLKVFPLVNGTFSSQVCPAAAVPAFQSADTFDIFTGSFGASPAVSWDGTNTSSGIVWALDTSGYTGNVATSSPAILHAYDATNLNELYLSPMNSGGAAPPAGPAVKFAVPTVANGKVYVGTQTELSVFGLQ
jgi:hypothetical protein